MLGIQHAHVEGGAVFCEAFLVKSEAVEAGAGEDDGIYLRIFGGFAETGGDVAADLDSLQVGPEMKEKSHAADAAGSDGAARGQGFEAAGGFGNEDVFNGRPGQDGTDFKARIQESGNVLEAVDGGVDGAGAEGIFEFFGEDAFVHDGGFTFGKISQAQVGPEVASGFDDFPLNGQVWPGGLEGGSGEDSLGEGEFAAAGS